MAVKKKGVRKQATKRLARKTKQTRAGKTRAGPKKVESKGSQVPPGQIQQPSIRKELPVTERPRITVANIRGDTTIGDLLVTFPRTREVLVRMGLKLEAEEAGDIYMTLDAFSAMNGLKTEKLVVDIVEGAKEPPPQLTVPQLTPTAST